MADEFDLKPTSRGEEFLDVILRSLGGDTPDIPQPAWRYEEYLAAIANAIQNGGGSSGGGVLVVHATLSGTVVTLDKTFKQIEDGMTSGGVVIVDETESSVTTNIVTGTHKESGVYEVYSTNDMTYYADSEDGYPYFDIG